VPTTQISLIREHTETIKPPRALWVPFELGRPLGIPNDTAFQKRVLVSALRLLEAESGPLLENFPEEAPVSGDESTVFACPVDLAPEKADISEKEKLLEAFKREMTQLRSWYDLSVKNRGRTTVGISGLEPEVIRDFICSFLDGKVPENPRQDITLGFALKLAVDDLKAFYFEAVTAQPGQGSVRSDAFADWFWGETVAAKVLLHVKKRCIDSDDDKLQFVGKMFIVPLSQGHRRI